jgi:hypothetical protein
MQTLAIQALWLGFILYLLYETSAVYSYISSWPMRLFKRWSKIHQYEKTAADSISYCDWMLSQHNKSFLVKLLSCRYCFGVWMALGICMITNSPENIPIVYFGGQLICSLFAFAERKMRDE